MILLLHCLLQCKRCIQRIKFSYFYGTIFLLLFFLSFFFTSLLFIITHKWLIGIHSVNVQHNKEFKERRTRSGNSDIYILSSSFFFLFFFCLYIQSSLRDFYSILFYNHLPTLVSRVLSLSCRSTSKERFNLV